MTTVPFDPEPTFESPVSIHVPGKGKLDLRWTFKFRNADEAHKLAAKWTKSTGKGPKKDDVIGQVLEIACAWEIAEEFTRKNLEHFFRNYPLAPLDVIDTYFRELAGARRKN